MNDAATLERPAVEANPLAALATLTAPDPVTLGTGPAAMLRMAQTFTIESEEDKALAAEELRAVKAKFKTLDEKRDSIVRPINAAVKAINDLFRTPLAALTSAETVLKIGILGFDAAQERIAANKRARSRRGRREGASAPGRRSSRGAAQGRRRNRAPGARGRCRHAGR